MLHNAVELLNDGDKLDDASVLVHLLVSQEPWLHLFVLTAFWIRCETWVCLRISLSNSLMRFL